MQFHDRNVHGIAPLRSTGVWARCAFALLGLMVATSLMPACSSAAVEQQQRTDKADLHYKLANNYWHAGNIELAIRELVEALEADDMHADSRYLYGVILFGRKRFEEAVEHLRKALQAKPRFFEAQNQLAVVYIEMGRVAEAVTLLEPLLKEPTYTTPYLVYNNLGLAWQHSGDMAKAEKNFRMSVFLNAKFCQGWRNLGLVAMQQRDYRAAVEHMGEATSRCPNYAELHMQLAEALEADGQAAEANAAFKKCSELAGDSPVGRRCKGRMTP